MKLRELCKEWGGNLASLNTKAKQNFIEPMIPKDEAVWIGAKCVHCVNVTEDKWMWASGDKLHLDDPMWKEWEGRKLPWGDLCVKRCYMALH